MVVTKALIPRSKELAIDGMQVFGIKVRVNPFIVSGNKPAGGDCGLLLGRRRLLSCTGLSFGPVGNAIEKVKMIDQCDSFERKGGSNVTVMDGEQVVPIQVLTTRSKV